MSTEARRQPDPLNHLKSVLESASWSYESLAEYVTVSSQPKHEEDVFRELAWRSTQANTAEPAPPKPFADMYQAMPTERKTQLRRWWHDKVRREAYNYEDLRTRLAWRYLV